MPLPPQVLIIAGVAALVGAIALVTQFRERKRREAYAEFCLVRGFKFEPQTAQGERRFRDVFESFQKGGDDSWRNTISGQKNGAPFIAFEYVWRQGSGKSRHTEHRCGMIWESDDVSFPKFAVVPEGWFSRIGQYFGMQDIDFPESPEFSRAYRLTGPNEPGIREQFGPEIRRFFEVTPGQQVIGGGRFLIWWLDAKLPAVERLDEWLEQGDQVRRRFFKA